MDTDPIVKTQKAGGREGRPCMLKMKNQRAPG